MKELYAEIERFQKLKERTGTNKSSSYSVLFRFDPWSDNVTIELGGYDVGSWPRHVYVDSTKETLLQDLKAKVDEAYLVVEEDEKESEL